MSQRPLAWGMALRLVLCRTGDLSAADKQSITTLCSRAFHEDFSSLFTYITDCAHLLAYLDGPSGPATADDGNLIGHASWSTRWLQPESEDAPLRTAYVDAVATDPAFWGCGVGSAVMTRFAAETQDFALGGLSTTVEGFYAPLGWERWRGQTAMRAADGLVYTPDECVMILRTPLTPPLDLDALLTVEPRGGQPW